MLRRWTNGAGWRGSDPLTLILLAGIIALLVLIFFNPPRRAHAEAGIASVYSTREGTRTASGEMLRDSELTAAHRTLRFGTRVLVTNRRTGRSVVVRINDRGPFVAGRVIDLTLAAARAVGVSGLAPVSLRVLVP